MTSDFRSERYAELNRLRWEQFLSMGIPLEGKTIFEPGAGIGDQTEWLLNQGAAHIYVQDGREENMAIIRERFNDPRVTILEPRNLEEGLNGYDFKVDLVFCYGVYYHVNDTPPFPILQSLAKIGDVIALDYLVGYDHPYFYPYNNPSAAMGEWGFRPKTETLHAALKDIWGHSYDPKIQLEYQDPLEPLPRKIAVASKCKLTNDQLAEFQEDRTLETAVSST